MNHVLASMYALFSDCGNVVLLPNSLFFHFHLLLNGVLWLKIQRKLCKLSVNRGCIMLLTSFSHVPGCVFLSIKGPVMYPGATVLISRKQKNKNKKLSVKSPSSSKATVENQYKLWHHKRNDPEVKIYSCGKLLTLTGIRVIQLLTKLQQSTESTESTAGSSTSM